MSTTLEGRLRLLLLLLLYVRPRDQVSDSCEFHLLHGLLK